MAPTFIRVDDRGRRIYRCPGRIPSVDCGNAVALSQNPAKTGDYIGLYFIHVCALFHHYRSLILTLDAVWSLSFALQVYGDT